MENQEKVTQKSSSKQKAYKMTMVAVLGAIGTVLMFISFNVPLMPGFIKLDFSELTALLAAFSLGPLSGVAVCLIKNLVALLFSTTGGVGELSNFMLGVSFVLPAGLIYKRSKNRKSALIGSLVGAGAMAVVSFFTNYFITYPIYTLILPMEAIMDMYQLILPSVQELWQALLIFNMPFTFVKGLCSVIITFIIYKKIAPVLQGKHLS